MAKTRDSVNRQYLYFWSRLTNLLAVYQLSCADKFDIGRKPTGHLALGVGILGCVGQNVARAEGEAVLTAIANKVDSIEFAGEAVWRPNNEVDPKN